MYRRHHSHGIKLIESTHGSYLYNTHGDVVQLVKENQVVQRYDYDAYGLAKDKQSKDKNDTNPFQYAGEYLDKESDYTYLRARYYDANLGRFINQDPIKDGGNGYIYAGGNPVKHNDPSGTSWKNVFKKAKKAKKKMEKSVSKSLGKAGEVIKKILSKKPETKRKKVKRSSIAIGPVIGIGGMIGMAVEYASISSRQLGVLVSIYYFEIVKCKEF